MAKRSKGPQPKPPAHGTHLQRQVEALLGGARPDLRVHEVASSVLVVAAGRSVAQVSDRRFRLMPDGEWEPHSVWDHAGAAEVRSRILAAIRRQPVPALETAAIARRWADALRSEGVPASARDQKVIVPDVGHLDPPRPGVDLPAAAREWVRGRTELAREWLIERALAAVHADDPRVTVTTKKGRLRVAVDGRHVAAITRYSVTRADGRRLLGDLRASPAPLDVVAHDVRVILGLSEAPAPAATEPEAPAAEWAFPQLRSVGDIAELLEQAGLPVREAQGRLVTAHGAARPPASTFEDQERVLGWVDAFVGERFADVLERAVAARLDGRALVRLAGEPGAVRVLDARGDLVAEVTATRLSTGGATITGRYLHGGPQWDPLLAALDEREGALEGAWLAPAGLHRTLPEGAPEALVDAAREAGLRLRDERTRAFEHVLRIDVADTTVEFAPIVPRDGYHWLGFVHIAPGERLEGELRLSAVDALPACDWRQTTDAERLAEVWTLALEAYAEISCLPRRSPSERRAPTTKAAVGARAGPRPPRPAGAGHGDSGHRDLPPDLRPIGLTARYLGAYVAGHRRRLQAGQHHSPQAQGNAARFGIRLAPGETWVIPHVRHGHRVPPDAVLHFAWRTPAWLRP